MYRRHTGCANNWIADRYCDTVSWWMVDGWMRSGGLRLSG